MQNITLLLLALLTPGVALSMPPAGLAAFQSGPIGHGLVFFEPDDITLALGLDHHKHGAEERFSRASFAGYLQESRAQVAALAKLNEEFYLIFTAATTEQRRSFSTQGNDYRYLATSGHREIGVGAHVVRGLLRYGSSINSRFFAESSLDFTQPQSDHQLKIPATSVPYLVFWGGMVTENIRLGLHLQTHNNQRVSIDDNFAPVTDYKHGVATKLRFDLSLRHTTAMTFAFALALERASQQGDGVFVTTTRTYTKKVSGDRMIASIGKEYIINPELKLYSAATMYGAAHSGAEQASILHDHLPGNELSSAVVYTREQHRLLLGLSYRLASPISGEANPAYPSERFWPATEKSSRLSQSGWGMQLAWSAAY